LLNIPQKMDELSLARFEIATLSFIRQALPPTRGFDVEIVAVTVLKQELVFPDHYDVTMKNKTTDNNRILARVNDTETSPWKFALDVSYRVVGVVTSGRVPGDFDLEDLAMYGLENHFDQYLWQLGNSDEFFAPLKEISDWPKQQEAAVMREGLNRESKTGTFVTAILFSLLALVIAILASYYAVRRKLRKQGRRKNTRKSHGGSRLNISPKPNLLEYSGPDVINYLTNSTNEDSTYHDGDVEGGGAIHFVKSIDSDEQSMESVGLTPRRKSPASQGSGFFSEEDTSPLKIPASLKNTKKGNPTTAGITFGLGGAQKTIKKWMTPRKSVERSSNAGEMMNRFSTGSKSVRFDPPEKEHEMNRAEQEKSQESNPRTIGNLPANGALKITKNKTGDDGEFTLPISFFSGSGDDAESDFVAGATPMSSLAGSNSSSYFSNIGKSFSGRRSSTGAPASLNGIPTNPTINENYAFSEASAMPSEVPSTVVNTERKNNILIESTFRRSHASDNSHKSGSEGAMSEASESSRVQDVVAQIHKRQLEAQKVLSPQPVPPRKPFANPHEGFETILGARSRSMEEDDVVQNMISEHRTENHSMQAPSSTPRSRSMYGYSFKQDLNTQTQQQRVGTPSTTLGARPLGNPYELQPNDDSDNKSSLSSVMQRPGTYDVYAPSGPIGIVVDTSISGPSVHSLKSNSPMLGLITAGDLIIALDNEDTRGLSAAELTRLMAKKSRQRERKITLYSVDGM
jgi:hypothetical protein